MKIAIPKWQNRVSPLFDVASTVLFVEVEQGREVRRYEITFTNETPISRTLRVAAERCDLLICGAISASLQAILRTSGIRLVSDICGPVEDVLAAYIRGNLTGERAYLMPGRGAQVRARRRRRGGRS